MPVPSYVNVNRQSIHGYTDESKSHRRNNHRYRNFSFYCKNTKTSSGGFCFRNYLDRWRGARNRLPFTYSSRSCKREFCSQRLTFDDVQENIRLANDSDDTEWRICKKKLKTNLSIIRSQRRDLADDRFVNFLLTAHKVSLALPLMPFSNTWIWSVKNSFVNRV